MIRLLCVIVTVFLLAIPAEATEIVAPMVPESGREFMPEQTESFGTALLQLAEKGLCRMLPDLREAVRTSVQILAAALLFSLLPKKTGKATLVASATAVSVVVFQQTDSLIRLASDTVCEISEYGKLLCPVMTAALAAQGAVTSSSALYVGTTAFTALLATLISRCFVPMVYVFLVLSAANCMSGEEFLKKFADSAKNLIGWSLKMILILFTTYMSITGVVAGTTDAAALKAAKITISTAVPVVGSILSDASEAVLVGMGLMKNAAGIYGILAALAVFIGPFLKIGIQYLVFKLMAAICSIFAEKSIFSLINDFSSALGLLLGMLAAACTMILISTVCFLKGAG